jgi:acetoacetate decarboxylase
MPVHFGGFKFDPEFRGTSSATVLSVSYKTDRKLLENYIPEEFELLAPEVTVSFQHLTEIFWLAGGQYNLISVGVPVRFNGKKDRLDGTYPLVIWENKTTPILTGREQTGMPKVYAEIGDLLVVGPEHTTSACYGGTAFLSMNFEATSALTGKELDDLKAASLSSDTFGWRYIPKVGGPGAELSQFVLFPQGMEVDTVHLGKGNVKWVEQTPTQNPDEYRYVNSLAALPIKEVTRALLITGKVVLHAHGGRVLE